MYQITSRWRELRLRLRSAHPDHHSIAKGMAWVAFFVLIGKLAGAAKEMAVAYRYGISADVDAYLYILNLVTWPISVWFSVLTVVLVPLVVRIQQQAKETLPRFRSELFGLTLVLSLTLLIIAWPLLSWLLGSGYAGLSPSTAMVALNRLPELIWLLPLGMVINLFSVWMLTASRHANTLMEGIPALVIAVAVISFSVGGVEVLVFATLAGFVCHLISLFIALFRSGDMGLPRFRQHSSQWPVFWQGFGIMLIGQAVMSFIAIVDQFFAGHLGTGAISSLSYANRILALVLGFGATTISRAALPIFSKTLGQKIGHVNVLVSHWLKLMFVLGLTALLLGWWLAPLGVRLLFERGAFAPRDTVVVSEILRYGLLQLPFYFPGILLVTLLSSRQHYLWLTLIGLINLLTKIGFNALFFIPLGAKGLMLSTSMMLMVSCLLLWVIYLKKLK